ncbi:MAG: DUF1800 family protein [Bacteroidota bacterium]
MRKIFLALMGTLLCTYLGAQVYHDYLGAGHVIGINVTTSHDEDSEGDGTIDGFPITDEVLLKDASRFLAQATMGYDFATIRMAAAMGYESWLDEQFSLPGVDMAQAVLKIASSYPEEEEEGIPLGHDMFRRAWLYTVLTQQDLLRHRINHALSQIFVVSAFGSDLFEDHAQLIGGYYNVLNKHTFGNYEELLMDVTLNGAMGIYLSHFNNPKADPAQNIHPDENYAREVMQLFSIGLYELNPDGTRKLTASNQPIPTYNNDDIREFAKIFTGLGEGHPGGQWGTTEVTQPNLHALYPMRMYEEGHQQGPKVLLNGTVVPAGQSGMQDIASAINNLHQHPNVGPFIGKALIQFLVSANPSPAYVQRVAAAFNNNGQGVRGDMKAVIKAILLDEEARNCRPLDNATAGKLREPIVRYTGLLRAFPSELVSQYVNSFLESWQESTSQAPYFSPSVFNFYQPEFQPNGPIAGQNLVAPVFQIHNSSTAVGYVNEVNSWTFGEEPLPETDFFFDLEQELELAEEPADLINHLDILLACGQLSDATKNTLVNAISQLDEGEDRLLMALYLILMAPDFAILK